MPSALYQRYWGSEVSPVLATNVEAGTYTLTHDGNATAELNFNDSAATVQAALEGLASIGAGNILVTEETDGQSYEFGGSLANTAVPAITFDEGATPLKQKADSLEVNILDFGSDGVIEEYTIDLGGATTGGFDIVGEFYTATVGTLDTAGIQAAFNTVYGTSVTTVTDLGSGVFSVLFSDVGERFTASIANNTTDGSPALTVVNQGENAARWSVDCWLADSPDSGRLRAIVDGVNGGYFNHDDSAATAATSILGKTIHSSSGAGTVADPWHFEGEEESLDSFSLEEDAMNPLRKAVASEIVEITAGAPESDPPQSGNRHATLIGG